MAKRRKALTKKRRRAFLEALAKSGNVSLSTRFAGVGRTWVYARRQEHPDFAQAWDDAEAEYVDMLDSIAVKRATIGEELKSKKTSIRTDAAGNIVGMTVTEKTRLYKSDRLLMALLDRRHPDYRAAARELTDSSGSHIRRVTIPVAACKEEATPAYLKLRMRR